MRAAAILLQVLGEAAAVVDAATPLDEVPGMDSLRHMEMVAAIERAVGGELSVDDMMELETVGDIDRLLARRGAGG